MSQSNLLPGTGPAGFIVTARAWRIVGWLFAALLAVGASDALAEPFCPAGSECIRPQETAWCHNVYQMIPTYAQFVAGYCPERGDTFRGERSFIANLEKEGATLRWSWNSGNHGQPKDGYPGPPTGPEQFHPGNFPLGTQSRSQPWILKLVYNNAPNPDVIQDWPSTWMAIRERYCPKDFAYSEAFDLCIRKRVDRQCPNTGLGNPICPLEQSKEEQVVDFQGKDGLNLVRYYNSASRAPIGVMDTAFGPKWASNWDARLYFDLAGMVRAVRPTGLQMQFTQVGAAWQAWEGERTRLEQVTVVGSDGIAWRLRDATDRVESYRADGKLVRIDTPDGQEFYVEYDENDRLDNVMAFDGRALIFHWGLVQEAQRVVGVTLPDGNGLTFEYDALWQRLESVSDAAGLRFRYRYNEPEHTTYTHYDRGYYLTGIEDASSQRYATFKFDSMGRAVVTKHAGDVDAYSFSLGTNMVTISTPTGPLRRNFAEVAGATRVVSEQREPCVGCGFTQSRTFTYTANGYVDQETDYAGTISDNDYDALGRKIQRIESLNQTATQRTTQTDWHASYAVPVERRTFNAAGTLVGKQTLTYNARGQVLTKSEIDPSTSAARTTTYSYCDSFQINGSCSRPGLLLSVDGPRTDLNDVTTYTYYSYNSLPPICETDPANCPYQTSDLWKVTNALGHVTEYLRYDGAGRVASVKDPNGVITDLEYHPRGWLSARKVRGTNNSSETDDVITRFDYWPTGLVKRVTQPDGDFLDYEYDAAHRLTAIEDALGNRIEYTLDAAGKRTGEVTKDDGGAVTRQLSRVYDQLGRLDQQKNAAQQVVADFGYDANDNPKSTLDALGHETRQSYDPLSRLKQTIQAYAGLNVQTDYQYDALDRLIRVTDPKGLNTQYGYDGLGNLRTLTSPDTGVTSHTRDTAGNRASQTDARGVVTNYTYDALNRQRTVSYPSATGLNSTFVYDTVNAACATGEGFALGRLTRMTDASGSTDFCYERFGNLVRKVQTNNGQVQTTRYAYSKGGRLTTLTYPSGTQASYGRNGAGQITSVSVTPAGGSATSLITSASYLPFGPLTQLTYGNGRTQTRGYDADYAIDLIDNNVSDGVHLDFSLDLAGNPTDVVSGSAGNRFEYDPLRRLDVVTSLTNAPVQRYTYDGTGNRLSKQIGVGTAQAYVYPATNHRLSSVAGTARNYDAVGNTTQTASNKIFTYDARNRLVEFRTGAQANKIVSTYQYNGKGERVRKYKGSTDQGRYGYDESGKLLVEQTISGSTTTTTEVIWLDTLPVAAVRNGVLHYVETDHLGTPRAVIHPQRNVAVWSWNLIDNPFGEAAPNQNPDGDGATFVFNLRYPGQYFDAESGLHYNYFRDYEAGTGRYVESDPIGLRGGVSTYGYVTQRPLVLVDPLGLETPGPHTFPPGPQRDAWGKRPECRCTLEFNFPVGGYYWYQPSSYDLIPNQYGALNPPQRNLLPDFGLTYKCCCKTERCQEEPSISIYGQNYNNRSVSLYRLIGVSAGGGEVCMEVGTPGWAVNLSGPYGPYR